MKRALEYTLLDPTGNLTLLAETPVPTAAQPSVARQLMALEPEAEQVGFVSFGEDGVSLRMAGGEFCGNASMSAAALYLERRDSKREQPSCERSVSVSVSGTEAPVSVRLRALPDGAWLAAVTMPQPEEVGKACLPEYGVLPFVRFPGITHVILEEPMPQADAEAVAPGWCRHLDAEALGLMFLSRTEGTLKPLVYVPEAGTLCWESSCASGTTAVGAYLAAETEQEVCLRLKQPGGTLEIDARPDGMLRLTGTVRILRSGTGWAED